MYGPFSRKIIPYCVEYGKIGVEAHLFSGNEQWRILFLFCIFQGVLPVFWDGISYIDISNMIWQLAIQVNLSAQYGLRSQRV